MIKSIIILLCCFFSTLSLADPVDDLFEGAAKGKLSLIRRAFDDLPGLDVNYTRKDEGLRRSPLHVAASKGKVDAMRVLVKEFNADVNMKDANEWTALHIAAAQGRWAVVTALIEELKADMTIVNKFGQYPGDLAFKKYFYKLARYIRKFERERREPGEQKEGF